MWVIIAIKGLALGKQRLAERLLPSQRQALVLAMAHDVFAAVSQVRSVEGVLVVTSSPAIDRLAGDFAFEVSTEQQESGYSAAARSAAQLLLARGASAVLVLPGDVPLVTATEIEQVVSLHGVAPAVTLVADRRGMGTNAVVCSPPDLIAFEFGPGSFERYRRAARSIGVEPQVASASGIAFDVDEPADLDALMALPSGTKTHDLLHRLAAESEPVISAAVRRNP